MSKIIKIISNKIAKEHLSTGSRTLFIDYTNILSEISKTQPGFISSNSYWKNPLEYNTDQTIEITSISEWKSINDWKSWYNSELRQLNSINFTLWIINSTIPSL